MLKTIEAIKKQFDALAAKVDPDSAEMLGDKDYAAQLGDCVAKTYIMLNNGMCEELTMCKTCAQQRDYLRDVMEMFEEVGRTGEVSETVRSEYRRFIDQLAQIRTNIEHVLAEIRRNG